MNAMITKEPPTQRVVRQRLPLCERPLTRSFRPFAAKTTIPVREDDHVTHSFLENGILNRRPRLRFRRGGRPAGRLEDDRRVKSCDEPRTEVVL